jgi:hypothetical protein
LDHRFEESSRVERRYASLEKKYHTFRIATAKVAKNVPLKESLAKSDAGGILRLNEVRLGKTGLKFLR